MYLHTTGFSIEESFVNVLLIYLYRDLWFILVLRKDTFRQFIRKINNVKNLILCHFN